MTITSTGLDIYYDNMNQKERSSQTAGDEEKTTKRRVVSAFSIKRNLRSLLSTSTDDNRVDDLGCLNGLRFWTMAWIILGHTMVWAHHESFSRSYNIKNVVGPFMSIAFFNAAPSVDTFFLIRFAYFYTVNHYH